MAAFNLASRNYVHLVLVFPCGMVQDRNGLMEGDTSNRRMVRFKDMRDIRNKRKALEAVINEWVRMMEG